MTDSSPAAPPHLQNASGRTWLVWLICLFILTFFQCRGMDLIQKTDSLRLVSFNDSLGVATGHAEWKNYQSRIAGPFLVAGASWLTGVDFATCHIIFVFVFVYLANFTAFLLLSRVVENRNAVYAFVLLTATAYAGVQKFGVTQDWDIIDFTTMFVFAYAAFFSMPLRGFVILFFVQLLNKESAAFIALWIILDGLFPLREIFRFQALFRLGLGLGLLLVGSAWTHFLRDHLLKQIPRKNPYPLFHGQQFMVGKNLFDFVHPGYTAWMLEAILIVLVVRYVRYKGVRSLHALKMGVYLSCYIASLLLFGTLTETRDWFELIPFMIFLYLVPLGLARRHELP